MGENLLYYGDNLEILREYVADESVDLVYLDPPFNSNRSYNVLFREANGSSADSQITAFDDTWHWGAMAEGTLREIETTAAPHIVDMIQAIVSFVGRNDVTAYLVMMTIRLVELHRVLKPTGSIYLHCDPTASHYLKIVMDGIFNPRNFRTEVIWKRSSAHSDTKQGRKQHGRIHDVLLFYTKSDEWTWSPVYVPYDPGYVASNYRYVEEGTGRRFKSTDLTAAKPGGDTLYAWRGRKPASGRYWAYSRDNMERFERQGRLYYTRSGLARLKQYLDEMPGVPLQDIWTDIPPAIGKERLGYQTQKPLALLERIVQASSNEGDLILDPFCGCGTTVCAAQELGRRWVGIDVTHLAIALMRSRLQDMFGDQVEYQVIGQPGDVHGAKALAEQDPFQFESWAVGLINARPYSKKRGADTGIDGVLFFRDEAKGRAKKAIVQVKSGHVHANHVRDLCHVVDREKAVMGFFVTLEKPTKPMLTEALSAKYYHSPGWNRDYQRIQIRTVEELLQSDRFEYPRADVTLARAQRAGQGAEQEQMF